MKDNFKQPFWVLGNSIGGIKSINWIGQSLESFANCGTLIVDLTTLSDEILEAITWNRVTDLKNEIYKRFHAGGDIICILQKRRNVTKERSSVENYFWSPLHFGLQPVNRGTGLDADAACKFSYLEKIKHWDLTITSVSPTQEIVSRIYNDNDETIGGLYSSSSPKQTGKFFILPSLDIPSKSLNVLLESLNIFEKTSPPPWISKITVPKISELQNAVAPIDEKIASLEKEKESFLSEIMKLENYKKLLYCKDTELEESIKIALEFLGLSNVKFGEPGKDDLLFDLKTTDFQICSIEVKGREKSVKLDDFRELDNWVTDHLAKGITAKGMMVANAFRLDDPIDSKEPRMDFSNFSDYYKLRNYCVMPTLTLLELVKHKLAVNDLSSKKIEETIVKSNSVLTLKDFIS